MSTPPLLLGAATLFWGHQAGLIPLAAAMALLLEGPRLTAARWRLSLIQFNRISDFCTVLFSVLVLYAYSTREATTAIMAVISWLPVSYLPLLAAQFYSVQGKVDIGALFMSRRKITEGPRPSFDLSYPYFLLCLLAASAGVSRTPVFYGGLVLLSAWALWRAKPQRTPAWAWAALLVLAGGLGHAGHHGLHGLQTLLENKAAWLIFGGGEVPMDPTWSHTAMGQVGRLKQSDEILLRVEPAPGAPPPPLLRQASFDHYRAAQWHARSSDFKPLRPLLGPASWDIPHEKEGVGRVRISAYLTGGKAILPLPTGATRLLNLPAAGVRRSRLGAVQVEEGPGLAVYRAEFAPASSGDAPPAKDDLALPAGERPLLLKLAKQLRLDPKRPQEAKVSVARFFEEGFRYSLFQEAGKIGASPLADFLVTTRSGHCEFFATATVLILRAGGIPARYATGFSVQEASRLERSYVVRQRHAHAWTLVYADGVWRDLDTTPSGWGGLEAERASFLQPLRDVWAWASFKFSRWRWKEPETAGRKPYLWLLVPVLLAMIWKLARELKADRGRAGERPGKAREPSPGQDSEFYRIEAALAAEGLGRRPAEALADWLDRLGPAAEGLRPLAALHNRYRFDPAGLGAKERRELRELAEVCLTELRGSRVD
ncbi:MAG: DUF4129 domain-containing transglutaminase family protein [Elusimicrobiota bacterium]